MGTRSEVKERIRKGRVLVNGSVVKDPGLGVSAEDCVEADGGRIGYQEHFYYMLNKPGGILTATEDKKQPTVLDLFPENMRKVRRGYKPHHLTNFRDAPVGVKKQLFRFAASDHMMIAQWCDIHIPPESTQQITAVYIKLARHLVQ